MIISPVPLKTGIDWGPESLFLHRSLTLHCSLTLHRSLTLQRSLTLYPSVHPLPWTLRLLALLSSSEAASLFLPPLLLVPPHLLVPLTFQRPVLLIPLTLVLASSGCLRLLSSGSRCPC